MGATVASFGTPLTRTRWASRPWLASLRVARSDETFNSVPFCSISFHCLPSEPSSSPSPMGRRDLSLRENDGGIRVDDAWEQCSNRRGDGTMGICRWLGVGSR